MARPRTRDNKKQISMWLDETVYGAVLLVSERYHVPQNIAMEMIIREGASKLMERRPTK